MCDADEVIGCQDETACNYNELATDVGECAVPTSCDTCLEGAIVTDGALDGICESCIDGIIVDNDADDDTVCDQLDVCEGFDDTIDIDGNGTADGCDLSIYEGIIPDNFSIAGIYPNPFNPQTNITYGIPEYTNVQITVFDISGKKVESLINESQLPGYHSINWNANEYPSGIYFIRMIAGKYISSKQVALLK